MGYVTMLRLTALIWAVATTALICKPALAANAPIDLTTCRMAMFNPADGSRFPPVPLIAGVGVTFVNHSQLVATEVDFSVTAAYRTELIKANGKFSPGIRIDKQFPNFTGYNYFREEPDACSIVRVKFADGSIWTSSRPAT